MSESVRRGPPSLLLLFADHTRSDPGPPGKGPKRVGSRGQRVVDGPWPNDRLPYRSQHWNLYLFPLVTTHGRRDRRGPRDQEESHRRPSDHTKTYSRPSPATSSFFTVGPLRKGRGNSEYLFPLSTPPLLLDCTFLTTEGSSSDTKV